MSVDLATAIRRKVIFSVPELAAEYGVSEDKVIAWIDTKQLRAINVASRAEQRRLRVRLEDKLAFEQSRQTMPAASAEPVKRGRGRPRKLQATAPENKYFADT